MNLQRLSTLENKSGDLPADPSLSLVRLFVAVCFGLLGMGACRYTFLAPGESASLALFLTGQGAGAGEAGLLWWKLFASFALGATAGCYFSFEIPRAHLAKARGFALGGLLFLISTTVYIPVMSGGFLWDDDSEVHANPTLRTPAGLWDIWTGGITTADRRAGNAGDTGNQEVDGDTTPSPSPSWLLNTVRTPLRAAEVSMFGEGFTAHAAADYFPLKSTFLWLQYRVFGTSPEGYHVVNIVLHALNAVLLWGVLRHLRVPGAWLGALLFAIHPVHAESVAWISEGKNTTSLLFLLLSTSSWLHFRERSLAGERAWGRLGVALLLYLASLLCKTSGIMFPFVLLLLAWWRGEMPHLWKSVLGLLRWQRPLAPTARLIVQTVPFFAISLVLGLMTIWFQNDRAIGNEIIPIGDFWSRLAGAGLAFWWYLQKAVLPLGLTTIYPRWPIDPAQTYQLFAAAAVPLVGVGLWAAQRVIGRTPFFVFAFFFLMLFPVLGFFKMSYMRLTLVADHFQYLSNLAVVALLGALVAKAITHAPRGLASRMLVGLSTLALLAMGGATWQRAAVHYSEETLWTDALKHNWQSWQSHNRLGAIYFQRYQDTDAQAELQKAHEHFSKAAELNPGNPEVHNNHGLTLGGLGHQQESLEAFRRSIEIDATIYAVHRNYAEALVHLGRYVEALEEFRIVFKNGAGTETALIGYGKALFETGRLKGALQIYQQLLARDPENARFKNNVEFVEAKLRELGVGAG